MAQNEETKKDSGEKKAQKAAAPAQPSNMQKLEEVKQSGDKLAVVNPATRAASVSLPTGETDENGNNLFDTFVVGKPYKVDASLLEKKNTEGINYLVEAE